jgi:hypothetical protein
MIASLVLNVSALFYGVFCFLEIKNGLSELGIKHQTHYVVKSQADFLKWSEQNIRQIIF